MTEHVGTQWYEMFPEKPYANPEHLTDDQLDTYEWELGRYAAMTSETLGAGAGAALALFEVARVRAERFLSERRPSREVNA